MYVCMHAGRQAGRQAGKLGRGRNGLTEQTDNNTQRKISDVECIVKDMRCVNLLINV